MQVPELSVVIPSVNGLGDLLGCLEAVERMRSSVRLEVLVVDRLGGEVAETVRRRFPDVRVRATAPDATIPQMRELAFREALGPAVAVIEDHIIVPPEWGRQLLAALDAGHDVVGGPIENAATERWVDWASFLCEYSACLPPLPAGPADWLPGNNVVYRRALLERYQSVIAEGGWENRLHDAIRADGGTLWCQPDILVGHKKHYTFGEYLSQRFLYARSYAGARVRARSPGAKIAYGLAALVLPPLLLYRTLRRLTSKGVAPGRILTSLPLIAVFVTSWGLGEVVGYWLGAGASLSRVR
jgi:glycosyltransferase involved in cell wall biosynthesis